MTKFVKLVSQMEGFGKPGMIPTTHHNPMDLRHSPHSQHTSGNPEGIGEIDTDVHGWEDGERQARIWADRGLTLEEAVTMFLAPPNENDSKGYLRYVAGQLGVPPSTLMTEVLKIAANG